MPLTNDDLAQLLSALSETPQFKFLDQLMSSGETAGDPGVEGGEEFAAEEEVPAEEGLGDDDLSDVQDLLVDEGGDEEMPPEEEQAPPDEEQAPAEEEVPDEEEQPTEKNILPALGAALAPMVATPAAAATTGALGATALGALRRSNRASGLQPARYQQLRSAHNKLVQEHGRLANRMQGLMREKTDAQRAAAIQTLARKYPDFVDVEAELGATLYSRKSTMDDAAFQTHCKTVEKYALRASQVARSHRGDIPSGSVDRPPRDEQAEKYQANLAGEAVRIYTDALSSGKQLTYEEAKQMASKKVAH